MQQIIYALGDVHTDFNALNIFINKKIRSNRAMQNLAKESELEVILLQCGDFGFFWPPLDHSKAIKNAVPFLKDGYVKIYWCAGNHENHDMLDRLQERCPDVCFHEVAKGVYFAVFGAVLTLLDGTTVLFCGGAESEEHDKECRIEQERLKGHRAWWPQEGIADKDMLALPVISSVDWVVSHARPRGVPLLAKTHHGNEPSQEYLEKIRQRFKPKKWLHGHYHVHEECVHEGCHVISLTHATSRHGAWHMLLGHMCKY